MIADNPKVPRAERFATIVDLALGAWAARWPVYLGIAAATVGLELVAAVLSRYDALFGAIVLSCVDGFATAFVSIDVLARFSGEERSLRDVARAAFLRWPLIALLLVAMLFPEALVLPWIFGSADETLYGMLILPALAVFGIVGVTTAIASLERSLPLWAIPGYALVRSFFYATTWPNLGRLTLGGAMVAVLLMLQQLLQQSLAVKGLAADRAFFWANAPIDALSLTPLQAFFTYLYLDFTVREQRR